MIVTNSSTASRSETDIETNQITQAQDYSTRHSGINQTSVIPQIPSGDSIPDATPSANLES